MPELSFQITGAEAATRAVTPLLRFELTITNTPATETVQSVMLQTRIRLEATQRAYNGSEQERLTELFGVPEDWGRTLGDRHWTDVAVAVPSFSEHTTVDLPVPCTYDLNVASAKYLYALEEGDVPLRFLFSGTVFFVTENGHMRVQPISRTKDSTYRMPVSAWREMIEKQYPSSAWMYLDRNVFERLYAYRRRHGLPSWEGTIEHLLPEEEEIQRESVENGLHNT